jgi:hypothetical protein
MIERTRAKLSYKKVGFAMGRRESQEMGHMGPTF